MILSQIPSFSVSAGNPRGGQRALLCGIRCASDYSISQRLFGGRRARWCVPHARGLQWNVSTRRDETQSDREKGSGGRLHSAAVVRPREATHGLRQHCGQAAATCRHGRAVRTRGIPSPTPCAALDASASQRTLRTLRRGLGPPPPHLRRYSVQWHVQSAAMSRGWRRCARTERRRH